MWGLTAPEIEAKVKTILTETLMKLAVDCRVKFGNDTLSCRTEHGQACADLGVCSIGFSAAISSGEFWKSPFVP